MKQSSRSAWLWLAGMLAGIIALGLCWKLLPVVEWLEAGISFIESFGMWGIAVYFLLYLGLEMVAFPNTPLNICFGLLFGFMIGAPLAVIATLLASMGTFLISRYVAQDWFRQRLESLPSFKALLKALDSGSFQIVLLARLNPLIPASVKNYGFALTEVSFLTYSTASFLGQTPIALAYVYLGHVGGIAMLRGEEQPSGLKLALIIAGVITSILMLIVISWYGRRKMEKMDLAAEAE